MTAEAAGIADAAARRELWTSFTGLLRSYLAGATLGSPVPPVVLAEAGSGALQIAGLRHTVRVEFRPDNGEGYWAVSRAPATADGEAEILDEGAFRLHLDAQFEWSGKPGRLEMDAVAEALAMLALS